MFSPKELEGWDAYVEVVGSSGGGGGEVAVSKVTTDGVLEVNVEILVSTLAEGLLHGELGSVRCPGSVDGPVGTGVDELEPGGSFQSVSCHVQFFFIFCSFFVGFLHRFPSDERLLRGNGNGNSAHHSYRS